MKPRTWAILSLTFVIVISVLAATNWRLVTHFFNRERCYALSDTEAKNLVLGIFEDKLRTSKDGTILVDIRPHELRVTRITRDQYVKGDGLSSINVFFGNKSNGMEVLEARIFEDCDVEWRPKQ